MLGCGKEWLAKGCGMRYLRLLLFGLFPLFAISCLIVSEVRQSLVFTETTNQ